MAHYTRHDSGFIVLIRDKASWHTSKRSRGWIRAYNRRAKEEARTRLIVCQLPTPSPWLMPLEAVLGWTKHQILGGRLFETVANFRQLLSATFIGVSNKQRNGAIEPGPRLSPCQLRNRYLFCRCTRERGSQYHALN